MFAFSVPRHKVYQINTHPWGIEIEPDINEILLQSTKFFALYYGPLWRPDKIYKFPLRVVFLYCKSVSCYKNTNYIETKIYKNKFVADIMLLIK